MLPQSLGSSGLAAAGIVAGAVVVSLVGIGQVLLDPTLLGFVSQQAYEDIRPITSILGNPNMVAMVLAFAAPFPIFGAVRLKTRRHRWLAAAAAFIILLGLALTFSRGGWVAAAAGLGIGTLLLDRRALLLAVALSALAWGTVLLMPVGLLIAESQPLAPAASPAPAADAPSPSPQPDPSPSDDPTVDAFKGMSSNEVRLLLLRDGLRIIDDHRLFGVGPGRYGGAAAAIFPSPVYADYDTTLGHLRTVHNFWLHLTGEVGALGVAVFLGIVVALAIRFVLSARTATGPRFVMLAGCATAVIVVVVHNFTEMSLEGNVPGILIWLTLGIGSTFAHASLRPVQHRRVDD
jgi:O-antigen ligase